MVPGDVRGQFAAADLAVGRVRPAGQHDLHRKLPVREHGVGDLHRGQVVFAGRFPGQDIERRFGVGVDAVPRQNAEVPQHRIAAGRQQGQQDKDEGSQQRLAQPGQRALAAFFHRLVGQAQPVRDLFGRVALKILQADELRLLRREPGQRLLQREPVLRRKAGRRGQAFVQRLGLAPGFGRAQAVDGAAARQQGQPAFQRAFAGVEGVLLEVELGKRIVDTFAHVLRLRQHARGRRPHDRRKGVDQAGHAGLGVAFQQRQHLFVGAHGSLFSAGRRLFSAVLIMADRRDVCKTFVRREQRKSRDMKSCSL